MKSSTIGLGHFKARLPGRMPVDPESGEGKPHKAAAQRCAAYARSCAVAVSW